MTQARGQAQRLRFKLQLKYVWESAGLHTWFHYTNPTNALAIDKERLYVVGPRPHQQHDHGLFLTTIRPHELSVDELLKRLFAYQRAALNVDAVVVLLRDDKLLPISPAGSRAYMRSASAGAELDLSPLYLGYGRREDNQDGWLFTQGLYVPRGLSKT